MTERETETNVQASRLSKVRVAGRTRFAAFFHEILVAGHRRGETLAPSWAAHLGVSDVKLRSWGNALITQSTIACGDLDALPATELLLVLEAWVERARARIAPTMPATDPQSFVVIAATRAGDLAREVTRALTKSSPGGCSITAEEWGEIESKLALAESEHRQAKLAARAAREHAR